MSYVVEESFRERGRSILWHHAKARQLQAPRSYEECRVFVKSLARFCNTFSCPRSVKAIWRDAFAKAIMKSPPSVEMLTNFWWFSDFSKRSLSQVPTIDFHTYERAPYWLTHLEGHDSPARVEQEMLMRTDWNDAARQALFLYMQVAFDTQTNYIQTCRIDPSIRDSPGDFVPSYISGVSIEVFSAIFSKAPLPQKLLQRLKDTRLFHQPFDQQEITFLEKHNLQFHLFGTPPTLVRDWMLNLNQRQLETLLPKLVPYLPPNAEDEHAQHALGPLLANLLKKTGSEFWSPKLRAENATPLMRLILENYEEHPTPRPEFSHVLRFFEDNPVDQSRGDAMQQIVTLMRQGVFDNATHRALATTLPPYGGIYEQRAWRHVETDLWRQLPQEALFAIVFHSVAWLRIQIVTEKTHNHAIEEEETVYDEQRYWGEDEEPLTEAQGLWDLTERVEEEHRSEKVGCELLDSATDYYTWLERLNFFGPEGCIDAYEAWVQGYGANSWVDTGHLPRLLRSLMTNDITYLQPLPWKQVEEVGNEFGAVCKIVDMAGSNALTEMKQWVESAKAWVTSIAKGLVPMSLYRMNQYHAWIRPGLELAFIAAARRCASQQDAQTLALNASWWQLGADEDPNTEEGVNLIADLITVVNNKTLAMSIADHIIIGWTGGWHKSARTIAHALQRAGVTKVDYQTHLGYPNTLPLSMASVTVLSETILRYLA